MADPPQTTEDSYFPIVVRFPDTGEEVAFDAPEDLPNGRAFVVIATRERNSV